MSPTQSTPKRKAPAQPPADDDDEFATLPTPPKVVKLTFEDGFPVEVRALYYSDKATKTGPTGNYSLWMNPTRKFNRKAGAGDPGFNNNNAVETAWNGREKGLMLRLSAPGSDAQIDECLKVLRDKIKTNKLATVVKWQETDDYRDFLAMPKETLFAWNDDDTVYVAGKEATHALELFLQQHMGFEHDEGSTFKVDCSGEEAQLAMARLGKLTAKWGFELAAGAKPDWCDESA